MAGMATELRRDWLSGALAGVAAALITGVGIQLGIDATIISRDIPSSVGTSGLAAGWVVLLVIGAVVGLVYAGLVQLDALAGWAASPTAGAALGIAYGLALWVGALVVVPLLVGGSIGAYALTVRGALAYAVLGGIVGLGYAVSPYPRD